MLRMTFGEAMLEVIHQRGLSATAVAEDLGFKNRTAFFRILHDESRGESIRKCFEAAKKSALLALSGEEIDCLREAIRVNELGKKKYGVYRAMHEMIYPAAQPPSQSVTLEGAEYATLDELLATMTAWDKITVVIMGRCTRNVMDRLHRLTTEAPVQKIVHAFAFDEEDPEDVKIFTSIANLLFSNVYSLYCLNETGAATKNWWLRSGAILFSCERKNGERFGFQLTPVEQECYLYSQDDPEKFKAFWNGLLRHAQDRIFLLKGTLGNGQAGVEQYIDFTRALEQLEHHREIYMIKPDLPINCVPPEILVNLVRESFSQAFPEQEAELDGLIAQMYAIHDAWVKNLYHKRRATHIVLHVDAMERFARTGNRSDHLFLCRPYTPQERVSVLTLLRDCARDNPNFHIRMSRDESLVRDRELTVYDGYGVALIKADTSWAIHGARDEVMLESKLLASYVKSYIVNNVLAEGVMSREESLAVLDALIEMAKQN